MLFPISIHAPHTRSDQNKRLIHRIICEFQSTLLIRGATLNCSPCESCFLISIHAPHTRSDLADLKHIVKHVDFNPRSSYEERPAWHRHSAGPCRFQSTLLIRGATGGFVRQDSIFDTFQSTLLIRGATRWHTPYRGPSAYFNPRSSYEERQAIKSPPYRIHK